MEFQEMNPALKRILDDVETRMNAIRGDFVGKELTASQVSRIKEIVTTIAVDAIVAAQVEALKEAIKGHEPDGQ
jgi:hypothetical protein